MKKPLWAGLLAAALKSCGGADAASRDVVHVTRGAPLGMSLGRALPL